MQEAVYSVKAIRDIEQQAIVAKKIAEINLMERAGEAALTVILQQWPTLQQLAVVCGKGNNGGDGYIVARLALTRGLAVTLFSLVPIEQLQGNVKLAAQRCLAAGLEIKLVNENTVFHSELIVDAVLGIGLQGEIKTDVRHAINIMNDSTLPIIALDIPSGLNADTGASHGTVINANTTITFIALKKGLFTGVAPSVCGKIFCDDLQLADLISHQPAALLQGLQLKHSLKPRARAAHKGDFGHVLIIGGDYGMAGAICLSAAAALRAGAGLVSVVTHPEHCATVTNFCPEIMCHGVKDSDILAKLIQRATVIVSVQV